MSSIEATLERLGAAPVEPADLERLEARVIATRRAARADGRDGRDGDVVVGLPVVGRRRPARLALGAVAASVLAVLVLAVAWLNDDDPAFVVASAEDVELVLPDGRIVAAAPGVELPTGTTIDVEGSLVVDGVTYGPGNYRVTDAGVVPAGDVGPIVTTSTTSTVPVAGTDPSVTPRPDSTTPVARTTIPTRPSTSVDVPPSTREPRPDRTTTTGRDRPSTTASEPSPSDRPSTTADDPPATSTPADRPSSTTTTIDRPTTTRPADRDQRPTTTTGPADRDQRPTTTESLDR